MESAGGPSTPWPTLRRRVMCDFGHAGDGGLHLNVLFPTEPARRRSSSEAAIRRHDRRPRRRRRRQLQRRARPRPLNADRWLATTPPIERRLVAALKDIVDPHRVLGHPAHPYNRL